MKELRFSRLRMYGCFPIGLVIPFLVMTVYLHLSCGTRRVFSPTTEVDAIVFILSIVAGVMLLWLQPIDAIHRAVCIVLYLPSVGFFLLLWRWWWLTRDLMGLSDR